MLHNRVLGSNNLSASPSKRLPSTSSWYLSRLPAPPRTFSISTKDSNGADHSVQPCIRHFNLLLVSLQWPTRKSKSFTDDVADALSSRLPAESNVTAGMGSAASTASDVAAAAPAESASEQTSAENTFMDPSWRWSGLPGKSCRPK